MPTNASHLRDDLLDVANGAGDSATDAANEWASALTAYASPVVPASPAVAGARAALAATLKTAFEAGAGTEGGAASDIETAFTTWAAAIGAAMAGFVAVPPPAAVGFASLFTEPYPSSHEAAADVVSAAIDAWFKTGTATPVSGGAAQNWA